MKTMCPACGSTDIETTIRKDSLQKFYDEPVEYEERIDCCLICKECGDFSGENESHIIAAIEIAKKQILNKMVDDLSKIGIKMAYVERALNLPPRTINRWKGGESSAASVALLRTIRTYPWILEVADAGFDPYIAKQKLVESAAHVLGEAIVNNAKSASMDVYYDMGEVSIFGQVVLDPAYNSMDLLQPMLSQLASNGD
jgi:hypothetical protein